MPGFLDGSRRPIQLGQLIGQGAEGKVFRLSGQHSGTVAKLHTRPMSAEKADKLRAMVRWHADSVLKVAAWPRDLVVRQQDGAVCGFIMEALPHCEAIHDVYGPKSRQERLPSADWGFLVQVARNAAAAFHTVHTHGIIIGDVNHGNLVVAHDATTKLIDCDSFQFQADSVLYRCEVGYPDFTPPELQGCGDFRSVVRTQNHDSFGLALLVFRLLFMGRHPFAGVHLGNGEMPIETAIRQFRYVYADDAHLRLMRQPPYSLRVDIVPESVRLLFMRAFTEVGAASQGRPVARDWVLALEALATQLHVCAKSPVHRYPRSLARCPWCAMEEAHGILFFVDTRGFDGDPLRPSPDIERTYAAILAIPLPADTPVIAGSLTQVKPRPIPTVAVAGKMLGYTLRVALVLAIVAGVVLGMVKMPFLWIFLIPLGLILPPLAFSIVNPNSALERERSRRQLLLNRATEAWNAALEQRRVALQLDEAKATRSRCVSAKAALSRLRQEFNNALDGLKQRAKQQQLQRYLDRFALEDADIAGIGPTRTSMLTSFGIETAADVTHAAVSQVPGIGPHLTDQLLAWRDQLARRFQFDAQRAIPAQDEANLKRQYQARRMQLETELRRGLPSLQEVAAKAALMHEALTPELDRLARAVAQAAADLKQTQL